MESGLAAPLFLPTGSFTARKPDDHNHKQSRFRLSPRLCRVDCNIFLPRGECTGRIDERTFLLYRSAYTISLNFLNFGNEFGLAKRLARRPATQVCAIRYFRTRLLSFTGSPDT